MNTITELLRTDQLERGDVILDSHSWFEVKGVMPVANGGITMVVQINGWGSDYNQTWEAVPAGATFTTTHKPR